MRDALCNRFRIWHLPDAAVIIARFAPTLLFYFAMRTKLVAGNWKMQGSLAINIGLLRCACDGAGGRRKVNWEIRAVFLARCAAAQT